MMDRRVRKQNEFIERARAIHGNKYDYSQVVYRTCKDKVRIVCPIHGVFEQTPEHHAYCGHGCLKCRPAKVKETVRSRYGVDYVSQSAGFQAKVEETNLRKYGVRRPMQSEDIRCKSVATSRRNWGTDYPMQNAEIAELYKRRFVEKYGVTGPLACDEIARRVRSTVLSRYGVENPMQDPTVIAKQFSTRMRTGTACTSSGEDRMCEMLVDRFGTDDVFFQYVSDAYPFHCDAYIKSLDLYIELNASWVHGGHWFDADDTRDLDKLEKWCDKALAGSNYYRHAIRTWTETDVMKRAVAVRNGLNYVVFWDWKLRDFNQWIRDFDTNPVLKRF